MPKRKGVFRKSRNIARRKLREKDNFIATAITKFFDKRKQKRDRIKHFRKKTVPGLFSKKEK